MDITTETLRDKTKALEDQHLQLLAQVNAVAGALQFCKHLQELLETPSEPPVDPLT